MPRIDLNIVDRQTQGSTWVAQNTPISADALDKVLEQQTNNATALNSLPTPFARFFVAREAFRKAKAEKLNPKNKAGKAYNRLVSDILDVYELLFDLKYHRNVWGDSSDVEIREWDFAQNMAVMKESMPVLYNSINEYYQSDINQAKLYFIVYKEDGKEYLLACSSPITGFVTPPDLDKIEICEKDVVKEVPAGENYKNLRIHRKSGGFFFDGKKSFEDRRLDFKNYMYNQLFGQGGLNDQFKEIRDFILSFNTDPKIRNDFQLQLSPINTIENTALSINGLKLFEQSGVDINSYFNDNLIRLPYKLSKENYEGVVYGADDPNRDYDFMWPFSPSIVKLYPNGVIDAHIDIRRNDVKVTIKYNGEEYEKTYSEDPQTDRDGKILDLKRHKINFDLGIFPNILSHKSEENKYFKVLVIGADQRRESPYFNINQISLSFYKNGDDISEVNLDTTAKYGVYPAVVRSRQKVDEGEDHPFLEGGTKFYELFNTSFDMIEVTILGEAKGLLMPKWKKSNSTNKNYTYAIDFGTSNTFVSRCENTERGEPNLDMKPQQFNMEATMVNYMHEMSSQSHFSMVERIEDSIFDAARNRIKTEFVPTIIDGDVYKFPIRTAICGIRNKSNAPRLFDNHNIAFFYNNMMVHDDQTVSTNIKWSDNEQLISVFIRELLLMIKCDILQRDGDLDCTKLVWFSPLSFSGNVKSMYERIWVREAQDILGINEDKIKQYSESEAPYYYYKKMNYIPDTEAVSVVDIGGGSTDFVYFNITVR